MLLYLVIRWESLRPCHLSHKQNPYLHYPSHLGTSNVRNREPFRYRVQNFYCAQNLLDSPFRWDGIFFSVYTRASVRACLMRSMRLRLHTNVMERFVPRCTLRVARACAWELAGAPFNVKQRRHTARQHEYCMDGLHSAGQAICCLICDARNFEIFLRIL